MRFLCTAALLISSFTLPKFALAMETPDLLTPRHEGSEEARSPGMMEKAGPSVSEMVRVGVDALPALAPEGNYDDFRVALERQKAHCEELDGTVTWKFGTRVVTRRKWCVETTAAFLALSKESAGFEELWSKARNRFQWYRSKGSDGAGQVMFTGYYAPLLHASKVKSETYHYPLYTLPPASQRGFSRFQIDWEGILSGKGLELAWVTDILDGFFLHIQGSGILSWDEELGGPRTSMANYAGQNGMEYQSIGKLLRNEGVDEKYLTLQGLRRYFRERPEEIARVLPQNPSYVYFRESAEGPFGSGSTLLTSGHSIATDNKIFPLGAVAFLRTTRPIADANGEVAEWREFARFAVNQDTGGAIKGAGRVDIFWGSGSEAEFAAGNMKQLGDLYFAVVP